SISIIDAVLFFLFIFFFFQAEDGIRDFHVTGVQTCALPIYQELVFSFQYMPNSSLVMLFSFNDFTIFADVCLSFILSTTKAIKRSEERRVGKESRSRWSPDE